MSIGASVEQIISVLRVILVWSKFNWCGKGTSNSLRKKTKKLFFWVCALRMSCLSDSADPQYNYREILWISPVRSGSESGTHFRPESKGCHRYQSSCEHSEMETLGPSAGGTRDALCIGMQSTLISRNSDTFPQSVRAVRPTMACVENMSNQSWLMATIFDSETLIVKRLWKVASTLSFRVVSVRIIYRVPFNG